MKKRAILPRLNAVIFLLSITVITIISCKKTDTPIMPAALVKPGAAFEFTIKNQGTLPDTVLFTNNSTNAAAYIWSFDDGNTSE